MLKYVSKLWEAYHLTTKTFCPWNILFLTIHLARQKPNGYSCILHAVHSDSPLYMCFLLIFTNLFCFQLNTCISNLLNYFLKYKNEKKYIGHNSIELCKCKDHEKFVKTERFLNAQWPKLNQKHVMIFRRYPGSTHQQPLFWTCICTESFLNRQCQKDTCV